MENCRNSVRSKIILCNMLKCGVCANFSLNRCTLHFSQLKLSVTFQNHQLVQIHTATKHTDIMATSIATSFSECLSKFALLLECISADSWGGHQSASSLTYFIDHARPELEEELGRLRMWGFNLGAHRTNDMSLDHKLRHATRISDQVVHLLKRLDASLSQGNRPPG